MRTLLAVALLGLLPAAGLAQTTDEGRPRLGEATWADVGQSERAGARVLVREALALLVRPAIGEASQLAVLEAIARLDRAIPHLPEDPQPALLRAVALARFEERDAGGRVELRTREALDALDAVEALDPTFEPAAVAWHRALLLARSERFAEAVAMYERVLEVGRLPAVPYRAVSAREFAHDDLFPTPSAGFVHLNCAEARMLAGDLAGARREYALSAAQTGDLTRALALFGGALAAERDHDHDLAMELARAAVAAWSPPNRPPDPVAALHEPGVGFQPSFELAAYEGVVFEALAETTDVERRRDWLARASRAWRRFFVLGGERSIYRDVATEAARRLESQTPRPIPH